MILIHNEKLNAMIQGVYYNDYDFIRFYKNGTFIACLIKVDHPSERKFRQILEWFDIGHPSLSTGEYKLKNSILEFKKTTPFGDRLIDCKGKVSAKSIKFETLNHNTGRRTKVTYKRINLKYIPKPRKRN